MADNYLTFSDVVRDLTDDEEAWLRAFLATPDEEEFESWTKEDQDTWLREHGVDEPCDWPGFEYRLNQDKQWGRYLWVFADDIGSTRLVGIAIQTFLKKFRPDDCFSLTYAASCSKLRVSEFGGGAIFVTADGIDEIDSADWVAEREKAWRQQHSPSTNGRKAP